MKFESDLFNNPILNYSYRISLEFAIDPVSRSHRSRQNANPTAVIHGSVTSSETGV